MKQKLSNRHAYKRSQSPAKKFSRLKVTQHVIVQDLPPGGAEIWKSLRVQTPKRQKNTVTTKQLQFWEVNINISFLSFCWFYVFYAAGLCFIFYDRWLHHRYRHIIANCHKHTMKHMKNICLSKPFFDHKTVLNSISKHNVSH